MAYSRARRSSRSTRATGGKRTRAGSRSTGSRSYATKRSGTRKSPRKAARRAAPQTVKLVVELNHGNAAARPTGPVSTIETAPASKPKF